jgi:hypothetical protein
MVTILGPLGELNCEGARASGEDLWLPIADVERATGWHPRPEGLCRGEVCVPIPSGLRRDEALNVAALWRHLQSPVVASAEGDVWVLGESAQARAAELASLEAPDFTLPDLAGREHSLHDQRGSKVLLVTWASW